MFSGNISKYFMMEGANLPLYAIMLLINLGTIVVFMKYGCILFGHAKGENQYQKVDYFKQTTDLLLGLICLFGGIFGPQILNLMTGLSIEMNPISSLEKLGTMITSVILGYVIYRYIIRKNRTLETIGYLDLGMRQIMISIGLFFCITLVVTGFFL